MEKPKEVTCLGCGWTMFEYPRAEAINATRRFNEWYDSQRNEIKRNYIDHTMSVYATDNQIEWSKYHSKIESYEKCFRCSGSYKNFRDAKAGDSPYGCTMQPIIPRDE